jgi:hypothetical protein
LQLTQHAHKERARVRDAQVAKTNKTDWFKRTGWLDYFANRNLMHVAHQTRLPDQGKVKLRRAANLTELLVEEPVNPNNHRYLATVFVVLVANKKLPYLNIDGIRP